MVASISVFLSSCDKEEDIVYKEKILGCMDASAVNYNPEATEDNGTCILPSQLDDTTRTFYSAAAHAANSSLTPWVDKAHSNVGWETSYKDLGFAELTGRFSQFDCQITFNEKDPSKTKINGWVQVSSSLTGEPGRDDWGKCGPTSLGVEFDSHEEINGTDTTLVYDGPIASTDTAYLEVNGAEFFYAASKRGFTTSYKANGTLKFRPDSNGNLKTSTVVVYFNYNGLDYSEGRTGFNGYFEFNAISGHGVTSSNIADKVVVPINIQVRGL